MASNSALCGACERRHISKLAVVWCLECDEGLCSECIQIHSLLKGTCDHKTIPIAEYQKLQSGVFQISQCCNDHKKKFEMYCRKHDCPCCQKCITEHHNDCKDIAVLDDVTSHQETSLALREIEESLNEFAGNIIRIKKDRQENLQTLIENRKKIEKEIKATRLKINKHLDKIQNAIMQKLFAVEENESKKIHQLLTSVQEKEKEIRKYQDTLSNIKQHASDLQAFLAIKKLRSYVQEEERFVSSVFSSERLSQITLQCDIDVSLQYVSNEIKKMGEITVKTKPTDLTIIRESNRQAQLMVPIMSPQSIDQVKLKLKRKINTNMKCITGCSILSDGRMAFADYCPGNGRVQVINKDGSKDFEIRFPDSSSYDLTYIEEDNAIAVSSGGYKDYSRFVNIVDLKSKGIKKKIPVIYENRGIAAKDKTLYFCSQSRGLRKANLENEAVSDVVKVPMSGWAYVATFWDRLYYGNKDRGTVTCCDLQGTTQWQFKEESVLKCPLGISADNDGNVYVVGNRSHNVVVISPDGERHRQLLSVEDGLQSPNALHFDQYTNQLLVVNGCRTAFLFDVMKA